MEEVSLALIGCGYWGKNYANSIFNIPDAKLKYIQDVRNVKFSEFTGATFTTDLDLVLKDPDVNGLIIATPTKTHYEIALKAISLGKHVLVEKPITQNSAHANELYELSKEKNVILMVGHIFKHHPTVKEIKKRIDNGEIGYIKYIDSRRVALGPIRNDASVLWDLAMHDIYIASYLVGQMPISVNCIGESYNGKIEDIISLNLKFPGRIFVSIYVNWGHPIKERRLIIGGTRKALLFDDVHPSDKLIIYDRGVEYLPDPKNFSEFQAGTREGDITIPKLKLSAPLEEELKHFVNCIQGKEKCITDGKEGIEVVRILEAAETSKINGGVEVLLK